MHVKAPAIGQTGLYAPHSKVGTRRGAGNRSTVHSLKSVTLMRERVRLRLALIDINIDLCLFLPVSNVLFILNII